MAAGCSNQTPDRKYFRIIRIRVDEQTPEFRNRFKLLKLVPQRFAARTSSQNTLVLSPSLRERIPATQFERRLEYFNDAGRLLGHQCFLGDVRRRRIALKQLRFIQPGKFCFIARVKRRLHRLTEVDSVSGRSDMGMVLRRNLFARSQTFDSPNHTIPIAILNEFGERTRPEQNIVNRRRLIRGRGGELEEIVDQSANDRIGRIQ